MQKKLGIAIGGVVGVLVILAIVLSITLTADNSSEEDDNNYVPNGNPITFNDFLYGEFTPRSFNGTWWSPTEIQWKDVQGNLVLWNILNNETTTLVSSDSASSVSPTASFVAFGNDSNLLLFSDNSESVWRHSFLAEYVILKADTKELIDVLPPNKTLGTKLQYAQWIPNSDKIAFVYDNNIYVFENGQAKQVTDDGIIDTIYNGIPDWVYEEEILGTNKAMYFTQKGTRMAFAQFNDTLVEEFYYTKYGNPDKPKEYQYPEQIMLKYPKVGTANPTVQLMVTSLNDLSSTKPVIPPTDVQSFTEHIYTAATWISEDELSVIWTNRVQNESSVSTCTETAQNWQCKTVTNPKQENGWLDVFQPPKYSADGKSFLQILPHQANDELHYPHIKYNNAGKEDFITNGSYVVINILNWDEANNVVYFMATGVNDPASRHLYSASTAVQYDVKCLTCELKTQRDEFCGFDSIMMNSDATYYVHHCKGPGIPEIVLRSIDGQVKYVFELNEVLEQKIKARTTSDIELLTIDVGNGHQAPVKLLTPQGPQLGRKLPLLVYVYGGPGSQNIDKKWKIGYEDYLVTTYGIAYAIIDGRGTGFKSNEYLFELNRRLGTVEVEDQIKGAKELLNKFSYLDADKTGIWGWSYGGYATAMTLIQDDDNVYKCGLSTAPPTDWLFYDSMYTERFMGLPTPEDNAAGYENASIISDSKVEKLRGKKFNLNHGVADDNVHYQQSMLLMRQLELKDIQFEQHSYPDENHGLGRVRKAVYHNFDRFWAECFDLDLKN